MELNPIQLWSKKYSGISPGKNLSQWALISLVVLARANLPKRVPGKWTKFRAITQCLFPPTLRHICKKWKGLWCSRIANLLKINCLDTLLKNKSKMSHRQFFTSDYFDTEFSRQKIQSRRTFWGMRVESIFLNSVLFYKKYSALTKIKQLLLKSSFLLMKVAWEKLENRLKNRLDGSNGENATDVFFVGTHTRKTTTTVTKTLFPMTFPFKEN